MNFSRFDMLVITTMTLSIVIMSFAFPALGLAGASNETASADIPEFDVSANEWDIAGKFPSNPGTPQTGFVQYNETVPTRDGFNKIWIDNDDNHNDALLIDMQNQSGSMFVRVTNYSGGNVAGQEKFNISSEGQEFRASAGVWNLDFTVLEYERPQEPTMYGKVRFTILEEDPNMDSGGFLSSIPVLGGLISAGSQLAAFLGFIGNVIYWLVGTTFELALTMVALIFDTMTFLVNTMSFMTDTYTSVITAAPSWSSVVLAVPGLLLFLEFGKAAAIGVSLLPFT